MLNCIKRMCRQVRKAAGPFWFVNESNFIPVNSFLVNVRSTLFPKCRISEKAHSGKSNDLRQQNVNVCPNGSYS